MKYLLEKVLVHHSDKNKLNYNSRVETIFTEYNTLEKLRKNIILENDTEYFIYYVDDIDINFDTDSFIFKLTNSNSISISLNCDAYVQQYLDFKINNFEKIIEERFKKQTQQEDDGVEL